MNVPLFVDFETNKRGEVFLAATCIDGRVEQVILDPSLAPLSQMTGCRLEDPREFALRVVELSAATRRPIAGYSAHDRGVLETLTVKKLSSYLNMAPAAKAWIKKRHLHVFSQSPTFKPASRIPQIKARTWSLLSMAKFLGADVPASYGYQKTTARIQALQSGLRRTSGEVLKLTPTQKRKVKHLFAHNAFDASFLELLYDRIAAEEPAVLFTQLRKSCEAL